MKPSKYVSTLPATFDKRKVKEDIASLREELTQGTLPPYIASLELFEKGVFKSGECQKINQTIMREMKGTQGENYITLIVSVLNNVKGNMDSLESMVNRVFAEDITKESLTYLKANLLQYIELTGFAIRYARRLLLWTYINETNAVDEQPSTSLTVGEVKWIKERESAFIRALVTLSINKRDLEKTIDSIPEILVTEDNHDMLNSTVGMNRLDPFKLGFIGDNIILNPFYHIGMAIADWQVSRYKQIETEKKVLEFRLLHLKALAGGNSDARLEQNIEYQTARLEKLNFKLAKMENDNA